MTHASRMLADPIRLPFTDITMSCDGSRSSTTNGVPVIRTTQTPPLLNGGNRRVLLVPLVHVNFPSDLAHPDRRNSVPLSDVPKRSANIS